MSRFWLGSQSQALTRLTIPTGPQAHRLRYLCRTARHRHPVKGGHNLQKEGYFALIVSAEIKSRTACRCAITVDSTGGERSRSGDQAKFGGTQRSSTIGAAPQVSAQSDGAAAWAKDVRMRAPTAWPGVACASGVTHIVKKGNAACRGTLAKTDERPIRRRRGLGEGRQDAGGPQPGRASPAHEEIPVTVRNSAGTKQFARQLRVVWQRSWFIKISDCLHFGIVCSAASASLTAASTQTWRAFLFRRRQPGSPTCGQGACLDLQMQEIVCNRMQDTNPVCVKIKRTAFP